MTDFDDRFSDAFDKLLDEFGESVEYQPLAGRPRTITVIIDRTSPEAVPGQSRASSFMPTVEAKNHATDGLLLTEVNTGGDTMKVSRRKGGDVETLRIASVDDQEGGVTVKLR